MWVSLLRKSYVHAFLVAVVGIIVYSNTFDVPFVFDDHGYIENNPIVTSPSFFGAHADEDAQRLTYNVRISRDTRHLGYLSFYLNYILHGFDVSGYHILNLIVHVLNSFLVYSLVVLMFRTPALESSTIKRHSGTIALFSALLFVSHPAQTQAVTYISQRFTSLATLFYLSSLVLYISSRFSTRRGKTVALYSLSLLCALCAMKTKETAFTLPISIALFELIFLRGPFKKRALLLVPVMLTMLIIPLHVLDDIDKPFGEALGESTQTQTRILKHDYFITQYRVLLTYLRLLVFPVNQNLDYDYPVFSSFFASEVFLSFIVFAGIVTLALWLLVKSRKGTPEFRIISVGLLWFLFALSVESTLITLADIIFEHRLYLPGIGLIIAATVFAFILVDRMRAARTVVAGLIVAVLSFSALAYERNSIWQNGISLWGDAATKSPGKARVRYNLGNSYNNNYFFNEAIEEYKTALNITPDHERGHGKDSDHFRTALEEQAYYFEIHNNLGIAYEKAGDFEKALQHYNAAVNIRPDYARAHNNLGVLKGKLGRYDEAIEHYMTAIGLESDYAIAHNNLGLACDKVGLYDDAIRCYLSALEAEPNFADAHNNLGVVFGKLGRYEEAVREIRNAISIEPGNEDYNHNLQYALALQNKVRTD